MRASHRQPVALSSLPAKPQYTANPLNLFVVVEAGDHHVTVLDGDRFRPITRFASHYAVHGGPKFSPDGRFVYFSSRDGWVTQYDLYSLQVVADIRVGLNTRNIAVSDDGNWILAGNTLPQTLVLLDAHGLAPVKTIAVRDAAGHPSRVSAVYEAAPRHSFVVALKDVPELWEISYDRHAEPVYSGLVHDYKMGESLAQPGFLTPRVTPLSMVLDDFTSTRPTACAGCFAQRPGAGDQPGCAQQGGGPAAGWHAASGFRHQLRARWPPHHGHAQSQGRPAQFVDMDSWQLIKQVQLPGPGFFLRSHENTPYAWADSMMSAHKDTLSIIDKRSLSVVRQLVLRPGKTTAHVEFTRDGRYALVSVMENPGELIVVDAQTLREVAACPWPSPSANTMCSTR
jgi:hypothetical protein